MPLMLSAGDVSLIEGMRGSSQGPEVKWWKGALFGELFHGCNLDQLVPDTL